MPSRNELYRVRDPLLESVNKAVAITQSTLSTLPAEALEAAEIGTTSAEDEDGNIYTIHPFMLDIDALDDPAAPLA